MQAGTYKTTGEGVASIWKKKGLIGLYQGYFGGIARDVPFRVAQLTTYELTKSRYLRIKGRRHSEQQPPRRKVSGPRMISQFCCSLRQRLPYAAQSLALFRRPSRLHWIASRRSYDRQWRPRRHGGIVRSKDLERGRHTRLYDWCRSSCGMLAPSVVILFVTYEQVQQRLQHWQVRGGGNSWFWPLWHLGPEPIESA
jgi:hypothetical protein